jgi:hypothetical protein
MGSRGFPVPAKRANEASCRLASVGKARTGGSEVCKLRTSRPRPAGCLAARAMLRRSICSPPAQPCKKEGGRDRGRQRSRRSPGQAGPRLVGSAADLAARNWFIGDLQGYGERARSHLNRDESCHLLCTPGQRSDRFAPQQSGRNQLQYEQLGNAVCDHNKTGVSLVGLQPFA